MASGPITSWQTDGETVADFFFFWAPKSLQMVTAAMKLKDIYSLEGIPLWLPSGKASTHNAGDWGLIPRLGRSPGEGNATHYSTLT